MELPVLHSSAWSNSDRQSRLVRFWCLVKAPTRTRLIISIRLSFTRGVSSSQHGFRSTRSRLTASGFIIRGFDSVLVSLSSAVRSPAFRGSSYLDGTANGSERELIDRTASGSERPPPDEPAERVIRSLPLAVLTIRTATSA